MIVKHPNRFDVLKICAYVISGGTLILGQLPLLGYPTIVNAHICTIVGTLILVATLIKNALANPTPPEGYASVVAEKKPGT